MIELIIRLTAKVIIIFELFKVLTFPESIFKFRSILRDPAQSYLVL